MTGEFLPAGSATRIAGGQEDLESVQSRAGASGANRASRNPPVRRTSLEDCCAQGEAEAYPDGPDERSVDPGAAPGGHAGGVARRRYPLPAGRRGPRPRTSSRAAGGGPGKARRPPLASDGELVHQWVLASHPERSRELPGALPDATPLEREGTPLRPPPLLTPTPSPASSTVCRVPMARPNQFQRNLHFLTHLTQSCSHAQDSSWPPSGHRYAHPIASRRSQ